MNLVLFYALHQKWLTNGCQINILRQSDTKLTNSPNNIMLDKNTTSLCQKLIEMCSQERDRNIEGVTSQTMLEYLPCSDKTRNKLLELMNSHKGHIFTDLSVHMLMVCLLLFDSQDDDSSIR